MAESFRSDADSEPGDEDFRPSLEHVLRALRGLRFGQVTLIVQDGVIVQIDRLERKRLDRH